MLLLEKNNLSSAMRPVPHSDDISVPTPLALLLLSAAPLRVATADISAQKIWQCFMPDVLPDATY